MIKMHCKRACSILVSLFIIGLFISVGILFVITDTSVVTQSNSLYSRTNIIDFSGIKQDRFFFSSSEENIKNKILSFDKDRVLSTIYVKKDFPNKIEIIITEKQPLFVVNISKEYIVTDKSFTMNRELLPCEEISMYILIEGIENISEDNFFEKLEDIRELNELLINNGYSEEEILHNIECIVYDGSKYDVIFRNAVSITYSAEQKDIQEILEILV